MGLARSTFYDPTPALMAHSEILARIGAICDDFECYGYRRVGAALRHQGVVVEQQEAASPDARPWSPAKAAAALRRHHR